MTRNKIDELAVASIRSLCIDEINAANSGHPGVAIDAAPILYTLWKYHLISDPKNPNWINRDRFILSSGHASSLLYAILHIANYDIKMDDLKKFRQLHAITTGHPEYGVTPGVDSTSGPLAQGIAQAVGVAMAERASKAMYIEGDKLINHYTYCLLGDGDLEEGLSQEAISLAGHHHLNKLIVFYDSNDITLDGPLSMSFSEDTRLRFMASGWDVITVKDGNNINEINNAIIKAKKNKCFPTLIIVRTTIGYGSKNQGTSKVHGAPLGKEDGAYAKKVYNYHYPEFSVPKEVYQTLKENFACRGAVAYKAWKKTLEEYKNKHPKDYKIFIDACNLNIKDYIKDDLKFDSNLKEATRKSSGNIINKFAKDIPFMLGGAADVAGSVLTKINTSSEFTYKNPSGRNINFGIREFMMASVQNGMLLHGGLRPYVGCFLVFSDYMKSAIRIAALSKLPAIYVFTHDSIYVGEDGPTHQPVEQLAMLRAIPNVNVIRPSDAREAYGAWKVALLSKETPTCLILTRQGVPLLKGSDDKKVDNGAYIIDKEKGKKFISLIASGSEVSLALKAKELLKNKKVDVRVISMPSMELFNKLNKKEQDAILGSDYNHRIAIEALTSFGWHRYAKYVMSIDSFGVSGKGEEVAKSFNFTSEDLVKLILEVNKNG